MDISLYVRTNYTFLSSLIKIDDLIKYAKDNKLNYLPICDREMFGTMEFYKKCISNDIKPLIGLEVVLDNSEVLMFAKNYDGYKNLVKLSTIESDGYVNVSDIKKYSNDVFIIVPFKYLDLYKELKLINSDIYLGYDNKNDYNLCLEYTDKIIYSNLVLCLEKDNLKYLKYLYMIRDGKTVNSDINYDFSNNLMNPIKLDDVSFKNLKYIVDSCNLEFPKVSNLLPIYDVDDPYEYLINLSKKGLAKRLNNNVSDEYINRLMYEIDIINKMGFCNYFLVVYDFIRYAKVNHILVGPGRGSAAGSLVSYCLGITDIDPIKYDLLFERFLNPERKTMPDIDTDFPDIYRDQVIEYVKEKYGERRVAGIVTFGTLAPRLVLRDVARVLEIPSYQVDLITKKIPAFTKLGLIDFYKSDSEIKTLVDSDDKFKLLYKIASLIEGFPRHKSSHAAGIVMSRVDLDDVIPLTNNDDMYLSGYSMEYLEELGLLKMDFLGLKNLTTIMNILDDIKKYEGIDIDFNKIPLDDPGVFKIFQMADTTGIFQFESAGMRNFLRKLHPNSFEDIFAAIALFRPGPASNIDSFIRRKEGKEEVTYLDKSLEPILKNTYGIIVYQEQIMQISQVFAGYTLGEADILRRAMSKKKYDVLKKEEEKFINKSKEMGHSHDISKQVYDLILNFANYGFNRSHSVAYSIIAVKMAYLKVKFPKYFYASLLTSVIGSDVKTIEYINEIRGKKINILKPDLNLSSDKYKVEADGIRFPLSNIKNIGNASCNEILNVRGDGFKSIFDFLKKCSSRIVNKKTIDALIDADCLSCFGYNHNTLYKNMDVILNYANLIKDLDEEFVLKPEIVIFDEFDKDILIAKEKDVFGFYLSNHPVTSYKIENNIGVNLNEIDRYFNKRIEIVVLVEKIKKIMTKSNEEMAFLTISDEYSSVDLTLFPKTLKNCYDISVGNIIKVIGRVERRYNTFQVIGDIVEKIR